MFAMKALNSLEMKVYSSPHFNITISACGEEPRLGWVPRHVHDTKVVVLSVASAQKLDGHNERILQQIAVNHSMRDDDARVVGAGGE